MTMTVYSISGAPRPWRVLLGLAFKSLDYDIHHLEVSKREHKAPEFLKINPRGTVPVLDANGTLLRDSIAALAWLDRRYPEPPLFGATPDDAAATWQITMACSDYLRRAIDGMLRRPLVLGEPLPDAGTAERADWEAAGETLHAECRLLEDLLAERPYLAGHRPSAADAVAFPEIRLIERAADTKPDIMDALGFGTSDDLYPRLAAWKARISALPGVDKTFPYHWAQ